MPWRLLTVLLGGYTLGVLVETPVLLLALSPPHSWRRRVFAGLWLTACTYPLLLVVLPVFIDPRTAWRTYILVGEVGVTAIESVLFYLAFNQGAGHPHRWIARDVAAVVLANVASYLAGCWVFGV